MAIPPRKDIVSCREGCFLRGRTTRRTATSRRGFPQSRLVETLRAASPTMPTAQTARLRRHLGRRWREWTPAQTMVQRCDSTVIPHLMRDPGGRRRGRTTQRTATSGRGFPQSRLVETLRAASPIMATTCKKNAPPPPTAAFLRAPPKKHHPKALNF